MTVFAGGRVQTSLVGAGPAGAHPSHSSGPAAVGAGAGARARAGASGAAEWAGAGAAGGGAGSGVAPPQAARRRTARRIEPASVGFIPLEVARTQGGHATQTPSSSRHSGE